MNKNQNGLYVKNDEIYFDHRDYNHINWKVYVTQMKAAGIPKPTILKIFKLCMTLYKILQFLNIV